MDADRCPDPGDDGHADDDAAPPPPRSPVGPGSTSITRVTPKRQSVARSNVAPHVIRTPLIPLGGPRRSRGGDGGDNFEIYVKLETLQPGVGNFKIRGASNALACKKSELDDMHNRRRRRPLVVTASAGNMGRAIAHACRGLGCDCTVIVPESAPRAKVDVLTDAYGARVIPVPYDDWWKVIETSDCSSVPGICDDGGDDEDGDGRDEQYVFVHPVCDQGVVDGNSTCGAEIMEEMPDVDAIFVPYGGGGLCCGIGSAVLNNHEQEHRSNDAEGEQEKRRKKCTVVSCEPETAAPMALSVARGGEVTSSFAPHYEPSFCDGCGGKAVLPQMWPLAREVIDRSIAVPTEAIEAGVFALHEWTRVVAEGAGGITVGAAMFCPLEKLGPEARMWRKVVCVVSGSGIDRDVLCDILRRHDGSWETWDVMSPGWNWTVRGMSGGEDVVGSASSSATASEVLTRRPHPQPPPVLSGEELTRLLPMNVCIDAAREALVALSNRSGLMPLRGVYPLPRDEGSGKDRTRILVTMPCYLDGYAACKVFTVFPENDPTSDGGYGSHNGIVVLFRAENCGEVVQLADAHVITSRRTAASSAAATMALARSDSRILAILGTGEQARAHFVAMLETGLPLDEVRVWGRNPVRAGMLAEELRVTAETYPWANRSSSIVKIRACDTVREAVDSADVICTVVPSTSPVLLGEWVKDGAHINAVGACLPTQRELDGPCVARAALYCDSSEACFVEAGDMVMALDEGYVTRDHLRGEIGAVFSGDLAGREDDGQITLFKSLGVALEDLTTARAAYERGKTE